MGCEQSTSSISTSAAEKVSSDRSSINSLLFKDLEGNTIAISDFKGKRVLLHFWATWCKPCLEELPDLEQVKPFLEKENYQLLLVSEESLEEIIEFQKKKGFDFQFVRYEGALSDLKIYALPATFILNEKGEKVMEMSGKMDWDSELTIKELTELH
ncbi:peroxiredoxin [Algoriphagus chordae]|uniref:Peroxiredoxin n=2 Tax=Algoriphagus chordae TaxID=237019 RepID=A0A2W7QXC9_9BACT|nr:peroxiredoxin [Algoriphagus chordae]